MNEMSDYLLQVSWLDIQFLHTDFSWWLVWNTWGSNVCSKFHENRGILKSILQIRNMGVFLTWYFTKSHQMSIHSKSPMSQLHFKPILVQIEAILLRCWTHIFVIVIVIWIWLFFFAPDKLSLYNEFVNIYKKGEQFAIWTFFLLS